MKANGAGAATAAPDTSAPSSAPAKRGMSPEDLLRFVWVADPQISPDGQRIAFTKVWIDAEADEYRTQIWLAGWEGEAPRPLTSGWMDRQPRWSPDGARLAFVRGTEPKKPGQLFVLPMTGGEAAALTSLEGGVCDPAWSPDGARLAFLSPHHPTLDAPERKKPKHEPARVVTKPVFRLNDVGFFDDEHKNHLWVIGAQGGTPRALTRGPFEDEQPRWSRDGRWIFFVADRRDEPWFGPEENQLYAVSPDLEAPTEGAELKVVVEAKGAIAAWREAEDGRIALIATPALEPKTYQQPGLFVAAGEWPRAAQRIAAEYDFPFGELINSDQHAPRGGGETPLAITAREVVARVGREGSSYLVRVELASGRVEELHPAGLDVAAGTASADGRRWALTVGSLTTPGDLTTFETSARAMRQRWGPNDALLSEIALGTIEEFWYPSFDGRKIQAWIVKPAGFDPAAPPPLVLEIHGGPHTAYGAGFFHEFHALAAAGYAVLYTNPRGSTSYGQEFADVIQYAFPGDDAKDLLAGVEAALARGYGDEKRLGVTGGSGGGLLTNWLVAHSNRFGAAITQRCVSDWAAFYYSADFAMFTPFWFKGSPWQDPEEYRGRSPVAFAEKIETPLMVIHSEEDWRTPIGQGEAMFRALKRLRKPTVMIRFPGESHELSRSGMPARRVENQQHIRRWLDRWLLGKPAPEYGV
jgi:dipeptidyl aminopeptidase/acylaminoacyl peptidase